MWDSQCSKKTDANTKFGAFKQIPSEMKPLDKCWIENLLILLLLLLLLLLSVATISLWICCRSHAQEKLMKTDLFPSHNSDLSGVLQEIYSPLCIPHSCPIHPIPSPFGQAWWPQPWVQWCVPSLVSFTQGASCRNNHVTRCEQDRHQGSRRACMVSRSLKATPLLIERLGALSSTVRALLDSLELIHV